MADPQFIDLSYTKAEQKEEAKEYAVGPAGAPKYPWGLCLRLEKREMDKLGMKSLPNVGDEFHLCIVAEVTQVSQQSGADQDDSKNVALQITMAQVLAHESAAEEQAEGKQIPAKESKEQRSIMERYAK